MFQVFGQFKKTKYLFLQKLQKTTLNFYRRILKLLKNLNNLNYLEAFEE